MFLAKCFEHVLAVDGSEIAIEECIAKSEEESLNNIDFIHSLINDNNLVNEIQNILLTVKTEVPIYIYSRFFLHSINDEDEDSMVFLISQLLENNEGSIYLEFRTKEDEHLSKYTGSHYRRYVDPRVLVKKFSKHGFTLDYSVQGVGFARFNVDDAHVARLVLSKA